MTSTIDPVARMLELLFATPCVAELVAHDLHTMRVGGPANAPTEDIEWLLLIHALAHMEQHSDTLELLDALRGERV